MTLILMVVSGVEVNLKDLIEDFAGEQVENEAVLDADINQVIIADKEQATSLDSLSAIAKAAPPANETAMMEWNIGAPVPPPVESFPGCHCDWNEPGWTCEGSAVFPRIMAGKKCCCCGIHCKRGRRCTDDQCFSIGVDQGDEVREEERKWAEMLKSVDFVLNDELPVKIVDLEHNHHQALRCTNSEIENACRRIGMYPVCDHNSYVSMKRCYTPGLKGTKFHNRHFSHWASHRQYFGLPDEVNKRMPGTCFMANNGNWALAPQRNGHAWTNTGNWYASHTPFPPPMGGKERNRPMPQISVSKLDHCDGPDSKRGEYEGWGCWKTFCVPNEPNYNDPNTRR